MGLAERRFWRDAGIGLTAREVIAVLTTIPLCPANSSQTASMARSACTSTPNANTTQGTVITCRKYVHAYVHGSSPTAWSAVDQLSLKNIPPLLHAPNTKCHVAHTYTPYHYEPTCRLLIILHYIIVSSPPLLSRCTRVDCLYLHTAPRHLALNTQGN